MNNYKESPILLKAISFIADEIADYETESLIYRRLIKIQPENIQAYRDLAFTYVKLGKYNLASFMYNYIIKSKRILIKFQIFKNNICRSLQFIIE
ncbi:MAG: hypothetical protein CM15mP121_0190 [Bacteroidota bacterium]|nr:MAG: hypothetical protein CM15mP121_0190 [Bacteroidota bacterium]